MSRSPRSPHSSLWRHKRRPSRPSHGCCSGGVKWRDSWRTAVFGDPYQIAHVTDVSSLDQYDSPSAIQKVLGDVAYVADQEKIGSMITGVKYYLIRSRPELSYMADPANQPMAILTSVDVMTDKVAESESFITSDWIPALKLGAYTHHVERQLIRLDPDLSFMVKTTSEMK